MPLIDEYENNAPPPPPAATPAPQAAPLFFVEEFAKKRGARQIVVLVLLVSLGIGSTIGVVPAVMSDRFARINHGYAIEKRCYEYAKVSNNNNVNNTDEIAAATSSTTAATAAPAPATTIPQECLDGSSDAQNAAAVQQLVSNLFTFFGSSLVGSLSDQYGRRPFLLLGVFFTMMPPLVLVLLQAVPASAVWGNPIWYYRAGMLTGLVNWVAVSLSSVADVVEPRHRATGFGLVLAGFSLGFAVAPTLAVLLGHWTVSVLSFLSVLLGFLTVAFFFPETVPTRATARVHRLRRREMDNLRSRNEDDDADADGGGGGNNNNNNNNRTTTATELWCWMLKRPARELSIVNRNRLFRILAILAFFSGAVQSADQTLLVYYLEERVGFGDSDVAKMFLIFGILGIFAQGVLLKWLVETIGERYVIVLCFALGVVNNFMYGVARNKRTVFVAIAIGSFVGMSFPTISAIKANNVEESEQGRIQGALYSLSALASALGPLFLRTVYHFTKDGALMGPGTMFVFAAGLYVIAVICGWALPESANSTRSNGDAHGYIPIEEEASSVETPPSEATSSSSNSESILLGEAALADPVAVEDR